MHRSYNNNYYDYDKTFICDFASKKTWISNTKCFTVFLAKIKQYQKYMVTVFVYRQLKITLKTFQIFTKFDKIVKIYKLFFNL